MKLKNYWIVENNKIDTKTQNILNEYLQSLKIARKSELTIKMYHGFLERFFVNISKSVEELTQVDILDYLQNNCFKYCDYTIIRHISILSSFFKFCQSEGYIDITLIKKRWRPRRPKPLPKYLDKNEIAKIKLEAEKSSIRNRTIFELLLSSGCRVAEAQGLNIEDIDLKNRTAKVKGKGGKIRFIHFTETCAILLEIYINTHPFSTGPLFLGSKDNVLTIRTMQRIINELGEEAALLINVTPHMLRHTFATSLLSKGAPLEFIGEELGHEDDNTTRVYARLPREEMVSLYKKCMG